MDIVDGKIGAVGDYDLELKDGAVVFVVKAGHSGASMKVELGFGPEVLLRKLAALSETKIDDAIVEMIVQGLKQASK